jgi:hypothetical protein
MDFFDYIAIGKEFVDSKYYVPRGLRNYIYLAMGSKSEKKYASYDEIILSPVQIGHQRRVSLAWQYLSKLEAFSAAFQVENYSDSFVETYHFDTEEIYEFMKNTHHKTLGEVSGFCDQLEAFSEDLALSGEFKNDKLEFLVPLICSRCIGTVVWDDHKIVERDLPYDDDWFRSSSYDLDDMDYLDNLFSGGMLGNGDREKKRVLWNWWLDEALPIAYNSIHSEQI